MPTIVLPRLRGILFLLLLAAGAYAVWKFYRAPMEGYIESHPAGQEHRPDIFGR